MKIEKDPIDVWVVDPIKGFINNSTSSGIVLFISALIALILSNSPWAHQFESIWKTPLSISLGDMTINKDLHHWINDGLVAIFFFVIGLELKREILAGELSDPKNAIMPLAAALGGMLLPAGIYLLFNSQGPISDGWGIPMATDIAFALGVIYLLGDRVPVSIKVFITTLAIADDLGAVLIIAFFYTSQIDLTSLLVGLGFLLFLLLANRLGVRNTLFYAISGIGGLWFTFLLSGIHPTIAAVLLAFTIPASTKVEKPLFGNIVNRLVSKFKKAETIDAPIASEEQFEVVTDIRKVAKMAITPLQRLEHALHPFVSFFVMPIFALSNAGVSLEGITLSQIVSPLTLGVFVGLIAGKVMGIYSSVWLVKKLGWATLPEQMDQQQVLGIGFLAAIGFTMSLFITGLAFKDQNYVEQAKIGILIASLVASLSGYIILKFSLKKESL